MFRNWGKIIALATVLIVISTGSVYAQSSGGNQNFSLCDFSFLQWACNIFRPSQPANPQNQFNNIQRLPSTKPNSFTNPSTGGNQLTPDSGLNNQTTNPSGGNQSNPTLNVNPPTDPSFYNANPGLNSPTSNSPSAGQSAIASSNIGGGSGETSEIADKWWRESPITQVVKAEQGESAEVNAVRFGQFQFNTTINSIAIGTLGPSGQAAVPALNKAIALLAGNQPVATQQYLAYMGSKAGFVDQAYAQSTSGGYTILEPIRQLWVASRNVAYLITSLTLVVIGFMIMLRKKIDAQTVIGIEQALPNLVITLLLITFSYAIAGFVIDMIYFVTFFGIKLLAMGGIFSDTGSAAINTIKNANLFKILLSTIFNIPGAQDSTVTTAANAVAGLVGDLLGNAAGSLAGGGGGLLSQPIAFVIFAMVILYSIFKLFFSLLMSYIQIIIGAILGPLQLMLNAMPGSDAFSKWIRNLLANAMAFPAAALMLVFAAALTGQTGATWEINENIGFATQSGVKWIPPLIYGENGGSGFVNSGNGVSAVIALFGIGILMLTPKVVDMVKEAIQAPEFKYGSAIGEAVGFGWQQSKGAAMWGPSTAYGIRSGEEQEREHLAMDMRARGATQAEINAQLAALRPIQQGARWQRIGSQIMGSMFKK